MVRRPAVRSREFERHPESSVALPSSASVLLSLAFKRSCEHSNRRATTHSGLERSAARRLESSDDNVLSVLSGIIPLDSRAGCERSDVPVTASWLFKGAGRYGRARTERRSTVVRCFLMRHPKILEIPVLLRKLFVRGIRVEVLQVKSFLVANPKGGSGKSTLATNLAGYFAKCGHRVMLGDTDRQQSARDWLHLRPAALPAIRAWEISEDSPARPPKGTSHVVLDTPAGLRGKALGRVLKAVSRVIVPVQPSLFDILATRQFLEKLLEERDIRKGKTYVAVVGMRVDARTRAAGKLERFLESYDLPILAYLRDTQLYVQVAANGMTLFDLPPSRAEKDVAQWQPIVDWVNRE